MGQITTIPTKNPGDLDYSDEVNEIVEEHNDTDSRLGFAEQGVTDLDTRVTTVEGLAVARTPVNIATSSPVSFGNLVSANATSGTLIVTLPLINGNVGKLIDIRKTDNTSNEVVITPNAADNVSGSATIEISNQYDNVSLFSEGTEWIII